MRRRCAPRSARRSRAAAAAAAAPAAPRRCRAAAAACAAASAPPFVCVSLSLLCLSRWVVVENLFRSLASSPGGGEVPESVCLSTSTLKHRSLYINKTGEAGRSLAPEVFGHA